MRVTYMTSVNHTLAPNATVLLHAYNFAPNPRKPAQTLAFAHKTSRKFGLAWSGDKRVKPRTQAGLALTVDGANWLLLSASIDLRQQILATPALQPKGPGRHSPIGAIVLTNAEVDSSAGLLALRERQPLVLFGTQATLDAIGANCMFDVVDRAVAPRRAVRLGEQFEPLPGIKLELFAVPGKVPLWLEEGNVSTDEIGEGTVCVAAEAAGMRLVYAPGCARVTDDLNARIAHADVLFFDGTLFADDEMIANSLGDKTGRRMGHIPVSGPGGTLEEFAGHAHVRRILIHINNSNPTLIEGSLEEA